MENVFEFLKNLWIKYEIHKHPPVFTVEEANQYRSDIEFGKNKNLFLRNKKGNKHYLVTIDSSKNLDLESLGEGLNEKNLGFASEERLNQYLGLAKGAVSPFGLINDKEKEVIHVLDEDLLRHEKLGFHPNVNTQTIILNTKDFQKFLQSVGNKIIIKSL